MSEDWMKDIDLSKITGREPPFEFDRNNQISELEAEIERLTHLHNLDHSLADKWQKKNGVLQVQVEELHERLIYLLNFGWKTVYMGSRANRLQGEVDDKVKDWLEGARKLTPHSAGRRVEKLEALYQSAKILRDTDDEAVVFQIYKDICVHLAALDEAEGDE